jgi:hypothetical protein
LLERGTVWTIERLDDEAGLDAAVNGSSPEPTASWSGLDHLEGRAVRVIADGVPLPAPITVAAGSITLDPPARTVEAGLPFTHIIEPLPPNLTGYGGHGARARLLSASFLLENTGALRVDVGRGLQEVPRHQFQPSGWDVAAPVSGTVKLRALGWPRDTAQPLWRIEQDTPTPFTLLCVTSELKVTD